MHSFTLLVTCNAKKKIFLKDFNDEIEVQAVNGTCQKCDISRFRKIYVNILNHVFGFGFIRKCVSQLPFHAYLYM